MPETSQVTTILNYGLTAIRNAMSTSLMGIVTNVIDYSVDFEEEEEIDAGTLYFYLRGCSSNDQDKVSMAFSDLVNIDLIYIAPRQKEASLSLQKIINVLYNGTQLLDTDDSGNYSWSLDGFHFENPKYMCQLNNIRTRNYRNSQRIYMEGN